MCSFGIYRHGLYSYGLHIKAYIVVACILLAHIVLAHIVVACMVMARIVMAYMVIADILMPCIVMAWSDVNPAAPVDPKLVLGRQGPGSRLDPHAQVNNDPHAYRRPRYAAIYIQNVFIEYKWHRTLTHTPTDDQDTRACKRARVGACVHVFAWGA